MPAARRNASLHPMSNIAKLKQRAAEFETRKQYEKALELYEQALNSARAADEERDVPLYNRVGDIHYRIGNNEQAIHYYEQAADLYADGGFFNNAIALCNKILRYSPGRTIIYYKLGIISARKGFNSDAKQNFLEYADRMQKIGKMDEAFRALKEFADLCPGQDDVRLMLAEQLARADRKPEALEQLQLLYATLESEGRTSEAAAAVERMKAIDPSFTPQRSVMPRQRKKEGLVFLDLDFGENEGAERSREAAEAADRSRDAESADVIARAVAPEGLEPTSLAEEPRSAAVVAYDSDDPSPAASRELHFITPGIDETEASAVAGIIPLELAPLVDIGDAPADPDSAHAGLDVIVDLPSSPPPLSPQLPLYGPPPDREDVGLTPAHAAAALPDDDFIDLGEWLQQNRTPASTRMVAHDEEPENDEQKDFGEMLDKFKAGISQNVDEEDFESHYDLGIAFREMGLLDEAIGSFQKASRGAKQHVRASEAIGQCFMDKDEAAVAMTVLERIAKEPGMNDSRLVGVLYLRGRAAEALGRSADAAGYYQRVLAVQIGFRDASDRLASMAKASR